ncbi:MAG: stage III sporulation protein AB [Clostridia bacterium]|nr:stage III sporulation protein AB [Clostridia bacterium]
MIIVKVISSIVIITISTMLGVQNAKKLEDREYILREFVTFLCSVKNEIKYMLTVLPNAYEIARQPLKTKLKDAIGGITSDMLKDSSFENIEKSIDENINSIPELKGYDKTLITGVLKNLGKTNTNGQVNLIENAIKNVENQINEAVDIKVRNSRLYRTIGALFGAIIVVVFI